MKFLEFTPNICLQNTGQEEHLMNSLWWMNHCHRSGLPHHTLRNLGSIYRSESEKEGMKSVRNLKLSMTKKSIIISSVSGKPNVLIFPASFKKLSAMHWALFLKFRWEDFRIKASSWPVQFSLLKKNSNFHQSAMTLTANNDFTSLLIVVFIEYWKLI